MCNYRACIIRMFVMVNNHWCEVWTIDANKAVETFRKDSKVQHIKMGKKVGLI